MVLAVDKFMRLNQRRRVHRFGDDDYAPNFYPHAGKNGRPRTRSRGGRMSPQEEVEFRDEFETATGGPDDDDD